MIFCARLTLRLRPGGFDRECSVEKNSGRAAGGSVHAGEVDASQVKEPSLCSCSASVREKAVSDSLSLLLSVQSLVRRLTVSPLSHRCCSCCCNRVPCTRRSISDSSLSPSRKVSPLSPIANICQSRHSRRRRRRRRRPGARTVRSGR